MQSLGRLFGAFLAGSLGVTLLLGGSVEAESAPPRPPAQVRAAPGPDPVTVPVSGTLAGIARVSGPTMTPSFSPQTKDYALWCTAGSNQVEMRFTGTNLAIDGARGTTVTKTYTLVEHQALVVRTNNTEYWMRCLPRDFPRMEVTRNGSVPDGWYMMDSQDPFTGEAPRKYDLDYAMITDTNGTPVWYMGTTGGHHNSQRDDPSQLSWFPQIGPVGLHQNSTLRRYDLTSQMISTVGPSALGHLDPHEYIKLRNGNYAWIVTPPVNRDLSAYPAAAGTTSLWDCVVQEVTPAGQEVWRWRMSEKINLAESQNTIATTGTPNSSSESFGRYDPYHCNALEEDQAGNIMISARNLNAILYLNRTTGNVDWKLGGVKPTNPATKHIRTLRTATGGVGKPFVTQHDARFTEGHTPASPRISLFDNQYSAPELTGTRTRGLEYAIDLTPGAEKATELWTWENSNEAPSRYQGAFRRNAATGENIFGWGSTPNSGLTEVDNNGVIKRRIKMLGLAGYRARKIAADDLEPWVLRAAAGRPIVNCNAPILDKEAAEAGALGERSSGLRTGLPGEGCERHYSNGFHAIIHSPRTGTFNNKGLIRERYLAAGGPGGALGYPTSDEFCGLRDGGCAQRFENGIIYWTPNLGANIVMRPLFDRYGDFRWELGQLGYPTTEQFCGLRDGGCAQRFEKGLLYQSPSAGIHPVWGAILGKYADLRWENGMLGYPTGPEFCGLRDGGCAQRFQGGMIYWSPASGAHNSVGLIHQAYAGQGYEKGRLRYPVTDERCSASGCVQDYQGGRITWDRTRGISITYR